MKCSPLYLELMVYVVLFHQRSKEMISPTSGHISRLKSGFAYLDKQLIFWNENVKLLREKLNNFSSSRFLIKKIFKHLKPLSKERLEYHRANRLIN